MMAGDVVYAIVRGTTLVRRCKVVVVRQGYYTRDLAIRAGGQTHRAAGNGQFVGIDAGATPDEARARCGEWWRGELVRRQAAADDLRARLQAADRCIEVHRAAKPAFVEETNGREGRPAAVPQEESREGGMEG